MLAAFSLFIRTIAECSPRNPCKENVGAQQLQIGEASMLIDASYLECPVVPQCSDMIANPWLTNIICHRRLVYAFYYELLRGKSARFGIYSASSFGMISFPSLFLLA
jgi:hypothetical protein